MTKAKRSQGNDPFSGGSKKETTGNNKKINKSRLIDILEVLARNEIIKGMSPSKLRKILEDLGPTFVKIGQIMSMRQDILPEDYCSELEKLRTDVNPVPADEILRIIDSEYGSDHREIFLSVDENPLGSASIAQVHKAVLKDGRNVVIKVQREGIRELMTRDIALLRKAANIIEFSGSTGDTIDLNKVLDEMWQVTLQEMDFLNEAGNIELFSELNSEIKYVRAPDIIKSISTGKVLVMEYIDGVQIDHIEKLKEEGYNPKEIASKLAENYAKQIIDDSYFHADPHPGNIRIENNQIVWIDLGMMGKLSPKDREFIEREVMAIATEDVFELQSALLSLGDYKGKVNHAKLYEDIDNLLAKYGKRDLGSLNLGDLLNDLFTMAKGHGIRMPKGLTLLTRGVITMEGVLKVLDPEVNIVQIMINHMRSSEINDFDLKKTINETAGLLYDSGRRSLKLPKQFSDFLKMMLKGQGKINLEIMGSEEPLEEVDHMVNKIILSITNAAVLLGSSLIATTDMSPKVLGIPLLGFFGYFVTLILSMILAWDILKNRRK